MGPESGAVLLWIPSQPLLVSKVIERFLVPVKRIKFAVKKRQVSQTAVLTFLSGIFLSPLKGAQENTFIGIKNTFYSEKSFDFSGLLVVAFIEDSFNYLPSYLFLILKVQ